LVSNRPVSLPEAAERRAKRNGLSLRTAVQSLRGTKNLLRLHNLQADKRFRG
jgi:hypothetical protein